MIKILKAFLGLVLLLVVLYLLGPRVPKPKLNAKLPKIDATIETVESYVANQELKVENLKPNNESKIVWADSVGKKTDFVLLYLHGFSASAKEGDPITFDVAKRYGCNMYLPRLYGHGIESEDAFLDLTPENLVNSAKQALAVAKILGDSVIIMSCSTGGTLSLYLAAYHPEIYSLIAYSPNIDIADKKSDILLKPWGLQLIRKAFGSKYRSYEATPEMKPFWTNKYRFEGLVSLKSMIKATMKESTFNKVKQPVFVGYYYKSEEKQDNVVSISRIHEMHDQLGTAPNQKTKIAFPNANDHVINSSICSSDVESVRKATFKFCENVLGLNVIE